MAGVAKALSAEEKAAIVYTAYLAVEGKTIVEIAEIVGTPKSTVWWRLRNQLVRFNASLFKEVDYALYGRRRRDYY